MISFSLFESGLYLADGHKDPAQARVAFLFQDPSRSDPGFVLSQKTWTDPTQQGFFAFFAPSATRDWSAFATRVRTLFGQTQGAQFGWFVEDGANGPEFASQILVANQGAASPSLQQAFSLKFGNIVLSVQSGVFIPAPIRFDDASNGFQFANPNQALIELNVQPPKAAARQFLSSSPSLLLPMDDVADPLAASVNAAFSLTTTDLAAFEAGFMFFAPPVDQQLTALRFPLLRAPGGAPAPLQFSVWLDVLQPLADTRTFFQCADQRVGCAYATATGQAFALTTIGGGDIARTSRLALANRPIHSPTESRANYYLTPAGAFGLTLDGGAAPADAPALLCGMAGTEFLSVSVAEGAADTLVFGAGHPAYQQTTPSTTPGTPPSFLSSVNGNVTTSWAQLLTHTGSYVSQPQDSPLFAQPPAQASARNGRTSASGLNVYLLDFLPLLTWSATNAPTATANAPAATPFVPMVPFAGLVLSAAEQAAPYIEIESTAINPTRKNAFAGAKATVAAARRARGQSPARASEPDLTFAMTPQGLLAGLNGAAPDQIWQTARIAISPALRQGDDPIYLQFTGMQDQIREALQQNQIFLVISTLTDPGPSNDKLFDFSGTDQQINIAGWPFSLSPDTTKSKHGIPPIVLLKFYPGQSIQQLVDDTSLWSQADTFNGDAEATQASIRNLIQTACEAVYGEGNCPEGAKPKGAPDTTSLYYNFYQVVTDPKWSGLLALNSNIQLNNLPTAIKAVTGGMTSPGADGKPISNIDAFRVHHVGVSINDTSPANATPTLSQSSFFGLIDYEKPASSDEARRAAAGVDAFYNFEVEYLRALFANSALSSFSCQINLTINNLFGTQVNRTPSDEAGAAAEDNVVVITGSYQAHSTGGDGSGSGAGVYSFLAEKSFEYDFATNPYLDKITLTKIQYAFLQETAQGSDTSKIQANFGIWGALKFKEFKILDIFSLEQLTFDDLRVSVDFDLKLPPSEPPTASPPTLAFNPGNLRLDVANSPAKVGANSLLSLLPFKLTSFLYNAYPDKQTVEKLNYYSLSSVPLDPGFDLVHEFNYALLFDLDLGRLGALVGSLEAFKFSFLIGWSSGIGAATGGIAFGVQLPQADGKLQIKIEGVLDLLIEQFILRYETSDDGAPLLVLALHNTSIEILGQRLPPGKANFDFALFAPANDSSRIGWIAAINNTVADGGETAAIAHSGGALERVAAPAEAAADDGVTFDLVYLGLGQRVGPSPTAPPTNFADFLEYMTTTFWDAIEQKKYDEAYHPEGQWLALADFKLLGLIEVGFVFYDVTPFYSLTLNVEKFFNFEITYTKISDSIGLFYANFSLPDNLRTFQVGAASLTLPSIGVSVYTNGNWRLDVGFPKGDDWSRSFRVEAQAGPVPVTGSGGFEIASLSSATSDIFKGSYKSIVAFGFAARLGVGKDFVAGPLKAGVSVTFFGVIQGAAGYRMAISTEIFERPDALSLQGQFGVIGEIYGAIDFVIIKASVNVRLQASIGIIMIWEPDAGDDGSILLYIQASVSVSVSVEIDLFLFSITISFSFNASFRFDWQLAGPKQQVALLEIRQMLRLARLAAPETTVLPLIPGFSASLAIWYTPEGTVVFPSTTASGVPWIVSSLAVEYEPQPGPGYAYADFKPFEKLATQLTTWALGQALNRPGWNYLLLQSELNALDQDPQTLLHGIDYEALLAQLAVFSSAAVSLPSAPDGHSLSACAFPMFPFFQLKTTGRMNGAQADDLDYVFASKNIVPTSYIDHVDAYFNQLFVNRTSGGAATMASADVAATPLVQEIFYDYCTGLIRGAVHQLLQTMQTGKIDSATIDALVLAAVRSGQFATLSGQMSSSFRGGARLPAMAGVSLTVPGGAALPTTNPLYALLWQEFPVGGLGASKKYQIALLNPDTTQSWITSTAVWELSDTWLKPLQNVSPGAVAPPTAPLQLPFTDTGAQAFSFQNPVVWTRQPAGKTASLRPFPSNLQTLQAALGAEISVLVQSRAAGALYLPGGQPLEPSNFTWATQISLKVAQVPSHDGAPLPDIFALTGASQQAEQWLEQILRLSPAIASIQVLYQSSADSSGLTSGDIDAADVFVLRTNTTTVSAPPTLALAAMARATPVPTVPVGAQIDEDAGFLQIVRQAAVTNATGYYLRYKEKSGSSLPPALFAKGPAPLTILITYKPDGSRNAPASPSSIQPFYNAISIASADPALVYYAETTDSALGIQYSTVAPGCIGVAMTRDDSAMLMRPSPALRVMAAARAGQGYRRSELIARLARAGVTDPAKMRELLAESGATASQLNALYSLVTYQVEKTAGFIQSNLSAPVQPQKPMAASSAADGLTDAPDGQRSYRVYVPLYSLAEANQPLPQIPNRYASLADPVKVEFFQNDAFGNQMPNTWAFDGANYYFDPILPLDQWQGVVPNYDFDNTPNGPKANSFTVYLSPSRQAFSGQTPELLQASLQTWTTIRDQIKAPGVRFAVETNLALQFDGAMAQVALSSEQSDAIVALADRLVAWLGNPASPFPTDPVSLTVAVGGPGTLPPAFEMAAIFVIERDPKLISPLLKDAFGNVTFPSAQRAATTVAPTVGASLPNGRSVSLAAFAAQFVEAFPQLALSVGLNESQSPSSGAVSGKRASKSARTAARLRATGVASDGGGSGQAGPQSLWAVRQATLGVAIGVGAQAGPFYLSPKPLDNALNTETVKLPTLPAALKPSNWPETRLFTDVDLDVLNSALFSAVDAMLAPASAAAAFRLARDAYDTIAIGRARLAELYANKEIAWLFPPSSPFTGTDRQLKEAQDAFGQQMRAALATAYTTASIVQYTVAWTGTVPAGVGDLYELYGAIQPTGGGSLPFGFTLSSPHVAIPASGGGLLTFLFGVNNVEALDSVTLDLSYNVTHIQHFLEPASATPSGEARPSIWLQLVNPYTAPPHIGRAGAETVIPLVLREYPTPPTLIEQQAIQGARSAVVPSPNPLVAAAAWRFRYAYQAQLTPHDLIVSAITYNSDIGASGNGRSGVRALDGAPTENYSLFESLARFSAAYGVIQPVLTNLADPNWASAARVFASLVDGVVNNTTWTPSLAFAAAAPLVRVTDAYTIMDIALRPGVDESRQITLAWETSESSFRGAALSIEALSPALAPYPSQSGQRNPASFVDRYTPRRPLSDDWIVHRIEVDNLNVLAAENALAAVQVERNRIEMADGGGKTWLAQDAFVYMTPVVSATQPITPFIDNAQAIDIVTLPNQGMGGGCPQPPPAGVNSLCQRIYTMMHDLLADEGALAGLAGGRSGAGLDAAAPRRVKLACSFQYPLASAIGVLSANPVSPLTPVVLARSFLIDGGDSAQLSELSSLLATAIAKWAEANSIDFGAGGLKEAQFVFDITLYAELSGLNTPVLRLRNLLLKTADIAP